MNIEFQYPSESGLVSVIITSYKRSFQLVGQALESALAQTYSPIEIILVDDNPNGDPNSLELQEKLKKYSSVHYIKQPGTTGAQRSRNAGILASRGEFIAFLDDDDIWLPEKIAKQVPLFSDPTVGLVYCDGYRFYDNNLDQLIPLRSIRPFVPEVTFKMELAADRIGTVTQAVIRRSCFEKVGLFDEDLQVRQDYEMWLRTTKVFRAAGTPEYLFLYRKHRGAQITKNLQGALDAYRIIENKYGNDYHSDPAALSSMLYEAGWAPVFTHHKKYRIRFWIRSFFVSPKKFFEISKREFSRKYGHKK